MITDYCSHFFHYLVVEWSLVADKKECSGSEKGVGKLKDIAECAWKCKGVASMFIFGTNVFSKNRCDHTGCECICETVATDEGTCKTISHNGYRLYKHVKGDYRAFGKQYMAMIMYE